MQKIIGIIPIFEANKGYEAQELRRKLVKGCIFPWICKRKKPRNPTETRASTLKRIGQEVECMISWLQRKFRRLAVRWWGRKRYWKGFLTFGWIN